MRKWPRASIVTVPRVGTNGLPGGIAMAASAASTSRAVNAARTCSGWGGTITVSRCWWLSISGRLVSTAAGIGWYFSNGDGTWRVPYSRVDIGLGSAQLTPGDFDGDRRTDVVITTVAGSHWYFSNGNGTWRELTVRSDLFL